MTAPISCDVCRIARHAVYKELKAHGYREITALRRSQRSLAANKIIFREGEVPQTVYTLFDGWAYKYKMLRDGSRQILAFFIPGDLILVQAITDTPLPFAIRAATEVTLCTFERREFFEAMMALPETWAGLRDYIFASANQTDDLLTALGRCSAAPRIAGLLASLVERMERGGWPAGGAFRIPVSQSMLADALGLTPVYVNRIAGQLRRDGIVEIGRNEIRVLDVDALRAFAERD